MRSRGRKPLGADSGADRADTHALAHGAERARRNLACLVAALDQRPFELGLVAAQLVVALSHRTQVFDDGLGDGGLEGAVARAVELALDRLRPLTANDGEDLDPVRDARLVRAPDH